MATLNALGSQCDGSGHELPSGSYEVILLLNNCSDCSHEIAERWAIAHPGTKLHIVERWLPSDQAHVGTARRLLMDTAWHRLHRSDHPTRGILTTDADTVVAPDWIFRNLAALARGADAVGGVIHLRSTDVEHLSTGVQQAYQRDREYQRLVAELEDHLDPQTGDPWPRHLDHFGASLSCTPEAYARAGGMPAVTPLEDVAFVDALRRTGARLRHEPSVLVFTSSRLKGRAELGLSGQLRQWQEMSDRNQEHLVPSAAWLTHRFRTLKKLRELYANWDVKLLSAYPLHWRARLLEARRSCQAEVDFLATADCDLLIAETFRGQHQDNIVYANFLIDADLKKLRSFVSSDGERLYDHNYISQG